MAVVRNAIGYIMERVFIGCSLASFVVCQFWSSIMFSPNVVGMSNAIAGGWGNAGERPLCTSNTPSRLLKSAFSRRSHLAQNLKVAL